MSLRNDMAHLGRRLEPPEGVEAKVGDKVVYEVIYDGGEVGTLTTFVDEFDMRLYNTKRGEIKISDDEELYRYIPE